MFFQNMYVFVLSGRIIIVALIFEIYLSKPSINLVQVIVTYDNTTIDKVGV